MNSDVKLTSQTFKAVGTRPIRPDGIDKVTGRARYGADFNLPGQLVGLILRSVHPHATIKKIDTAKAQALPGVKAVVTAADLPDLTDGDKDLLAVLENSMARKKVYYDGHAVAAVAAIDAKTAKAALKLIEVEYRLHKHVTDVDEAMTAKAPVLHKDCFTKGVKPTPDKPSNIANVSEFGHGNIKKGFKQADLIIERTFRTEQTHQGYIEPHACVASVSPDGTGELWVCTQGHFVFRQQCALLMGMDEAKLRVTASEIGGGFGGKTHLWLEPVALALSRKANRPVKLVMTREEVFRGTH
jgi:CO/xanthine dehydrogenase Mo-binding subunit